MRTSQGIATLTENKKHLCQGIATLKTKKTQFVFC